MLNSEYNSSKLYSRRHFCVLIIGVIAWFIIQGLLINYPLWTRSLPPEVDDAYSYIYRSAQMKDCFLQDCKAIKDLESQVYKELNDISENIVVRKRAYRIIIDVFYTYHPLFSAIQVGINSFIHSWELTHKITWLLGYIFIGSAVVYLLTTIWSPTIAGISLIFLSIQIFQDQGLHFIVPSNLSLGMALFIFGKIIKNNGKAPYTLTLGTVLLVTMHTIGFIYAGIAILLSMSLRRNDFDSIREGWRSYLITFGIIISYYFLPNIINEPKFMMPKYPEVFDYSHAAIVNLFKEGGQIIEQFTRIYGFSGIGIVIFSAITWKGLIIFVDNNKVIGNRVINFLVIYTLICLSSLLFFPLLVPYNPLNLFGRLFIILEILIIGFFSQSFCYYIKLKKGKFVNFKNIGLSFYMIAVLIFGFRSITYHMLSVYKRHNYSFNYKDFSQFSNNYFKQSDNILYNDRYVMYPVLTYGGQKIGASFGNGKIISKIKNDIDYYVFRNPVSLLSISRDEKIHTSSFQAIKIEFEDSKRINQIYLNIFNDESNDSLHLILLDKFDKEIDSNKINFPRNFVGWKSIPLDSSIPIKKILLENSYKSSLWFSGIKFKDNNHYWPWESKATIEFLPNDGNYFKEYFPLISNISITNKQQKVSFDMDKYLLRRQPEIVNRNKRVIYDKGFIVILKLTDYNS